MKRRIVKSVIVAALACLVGTLAFAQNHASGQMMTGGQMGEHGADIGMKIHESTVNGYHLTYRLIDMRERMKGMKGMPQMKATHHLMVFVKGADGNKVEKGKVGYLIKNPDGRDQKVMCMGMSGGFGGDVEFGKNGKYHIKTKMMAGDMKLMDSFEYEVK